MPRHGAHSFHGKNQQMRVCLDCPTPIPAYGNKVRCPACASIRYEMLKKERGRRRTERERAAKGLG